MTHYLLFLFFASLAVASPGPGVVLTLSNTVRFGMRGALWGMLGLSAGIFIVATLSALGLAALLAASATAFSVLKYFGAAYLVYLGIKLWRAPVLSEAEETMRQGRFSEALLMQISNPKVVFFFVSVFPQFIDFSADYGRQFILLVFSYTLLLLLIHVVYAALALKISAWIKSPRGGRLLNRLSGSAFVGFGVALACSNR